MISEECKDLLVDKINNFEVTLGGVTYTIPSQRWKETGSIKAFGIIVNFEQDLTPYIEPLGHIIGHYPDRTITFENEEYRVRGDSIRGYWTKCRVYVSVHVSETKVRNVDGDKLAAKSMEYLIPYIKREWNKILSNYDAYIMHAFGKITNSPLLISQGEWVYRYTVRFDIVSKFTWTEEPENPGENVILGISGKVFDSNFDEEIGEFSTEY